jgi:hypothetical protein
MTLQAFCNARSTVQRHWSNGRIRRSHRRDPGSIPGWRKSFWSLRTEWVNTLASKTLFNHRPHSPCLCMYSLCPCDAPVSTWCSVSNQSEKYFAPTNTRRCEACIHFRLSYIGSPQMQDNHYSLTSCVGFRDTRSVDTENFSTNSRHWSSGRIYRCHRCDPGSIPGWRILFPPAHVFPRFKDCPHHPYMLRGVNTETAHMLATYLCER